MKWYQKKWVIILFLIFFFPVGLFLLLKYGFQENTETLYINNTRENTTNTTSTTNTIKWYKYWKVYIGIGIFFTLSVFNNSLSLNMIPNIIFAILFLYLGITQRKKAYANPEYVKEMERQKQEKALARIPHQQRYQDCKKIHTKIVGVTFKNDDGSPRQYYLSNLNNNEQLYLKEYVYKGNLAFHVCNKRGQCLGNLAEDIAQKIKTKYDEKEKIVFVEEVDSFDRNELYNRKREEEDYIYYCKIVIYFK